MWHEEPVWDAHCIQRLHQTRSVYWNRSCFGLSPQTSPVHQIQHLGLVWHGCQTQHAPWTGPATSGAGVDTYYTLHPAQRSRSGTCCMQHTGPVHSPNPAHRLALCTSFGPRYNIPTLAYASVTQLAASNKDSLILALQESLQSRVPITEKCHILGTSTCAY